MSLPLALYRLGTGLAQPLAPGLLKRRAARGKEDPARIGERLGHAAKPRPPGPLAWLHGASVGESLSVLPLVERLRAERPDIAVLVTSGTVTSAELLERRLPNGAVHQFAPVDAPGAVRRFLDHWRPDLGVFIESELWPNLLLGAERRGMKLALLSARITEGSAAGWLKAPASARKLLSAFDLVMPQDAGSEARLKTLGAAVHGCLNLKLVGAPLPFDAAERDRLKSAIGKRPVVLAASTHPGEDERIASAVPRDAFLIVAPRHPERGEAVAVALNGTRRSKSEPLDPARPYIADTLGEMGLLFALADLVVMGGGFVDSVGGHNPLEPARLGAPVISGPHAFNFADIYAEMEAEGAAVIASADDLARAVATLLADPDALRRLGEAGRAFTASRAAALDEAWSKLQPLLP